MHNDWALLVLRQLNYRYWCYFAVANIMLIFPFNTPYPLAACFFVILDKRQNCVEYNATVFVYVHKFV